MPSQFLSEASPSVMIPSPADTPSPRYGYDSQLYDPSLPNPQANSMFNGGDGSASQTEYSLHPPHPTQFNLKSTESVSDDGINYSRGVGSYENVAGNVSHQAISISHDSTNTVALYFPQVGTEGEDALFLGTVNEHGSVLFSRAIIFNMSISEFILEQLRMPLALLDSRNLTALERWGPDIVAHHQAKFNLRGVLAELRHDINFTKCWRVGENAVWKAWLRSRPQRIWYINGNNRWRRVPHPETKEGGGVGSEKVCTEERDGVDGGGVSEKDGSNEGEDSNMVSEDGDGNENGKLSSNDDGEEVKMLLKEDVKEESISLMGDDHNSHYFWKNPYLECEYGGNQDEKHSLLDSVNI